MRLVNDNLIIIEVNPMVDLNQGSRWKLICSGLRNKISQPTFKKVSCEAKWMGVLGEQWGAVGVEMRYNPIRDELIILSYQFKDFQIRLPCEFNTPVVS